MKEFQLLKSIYTVLEEIYFTEYIEVLLKIGHSAMNRRWCTVLTFFFFLSFFKDLITYF